MKSVATILLCSLLGPIAAQYEDLEISGPFYGESSRIPKNLGAPKVVVVKHSWFDEPIEEAEDALRNSFDGVGNFAASTYEGAKSGINGALNSTEQFIGETSSKASNSIKRVVSNVGSNINSAANQTKYFFIKSSKDAKGFFSSTWESATGWFTKLEEEAKQLLHFVLRIVEISVVIIILLVFVWILRRVSSGYRFVKGIAESFEMHDRTDTPHIV